MHSKPHFITKEPDPTEEPLATILRVLNEAVTADRQAVKDLLSHKVVCNQSMADHPDILVGTRTTEYGDENVLGTLGLLNGIIERVTGRRVAAVLTDPGPDGMRELQRFSVYTPDQE